jgi:hypothetical protein
LAYLMLSPWFVMHQPRTVTSDRQIDRPYEQVAALLRSQTMDLLQRATMPAATRAGSLAARLHVEVVGLEIGVNVRLFVRRVRDRVARGDLPRGLTVEMTWEAIRSPALFPSMLAELVARPVSASKVALEIRGAYWTPMGPIGTAIDALIGHRIAEASVNGFLDDVAAQLRREVPS